MIPNFRKNFKRRNSVPQIKWRILRSCSRINQSSLSAIYVLNEQLEIALFKGNNILNRRTELISKCRHINKHTHLRHDTTAWKSIFSFFGRPEKMFFPKKSPRNMIFFILLRKIMFLFLENMILTLGGK